MLFKLSTKQYLNTDYMISLIVNKIDKGTHFAVAARLIDNSTHVLKEFEHELDAVRFAENMHKEVNVHKIVLVKH